MVSIINDPRHPYYRCVRKGLIRGRGGNGGGGGLGRVCESGGGGESGGGCR